VRHRYGAARRLALVPRRPQALAAHLRFEALDAADLNRIVTTINRSSVLNRRAALAAAASAGCLALRFAADLLAKF